MLEQLPKERRNWVLLALAVLVLWLAWSLRAVINPLLLGYLMAFIAHPMVRRLESRGWQHRNAVAAVFAGTFVLTVLMLTGLFLQGRSLVEDLLRTANQSQAEGPVEPGGDAESVAMGSPSAAAEGSDSQELDPAVSNPPAEGGADDVPAATEGETAETPVESAADAIEPGAVQAWLDRAEGWLDGLPGSELLPQLPSEAELTGSLSTWLLKDGDGGESVGMQALTVVLNALGRLLDGLFGIGELALLVPLYAFFWMFELDSFHAWIRRHLPWRHRGQLVRFGRKVGDVIASFFRGRLTVCVIKGVYLTVVLGLAGVPYAMLLGLAGGFLSLIPFVGGALAFLLGLSSGLLVYGPVGALLAAGLAFGTAELIEGYILVPKILGKTLGLSEVGVLFAVTAGGALLGLFGVIVALPLAAAVKVAFLEFVEPALQEFAEEEETIVTG